MTISEQKTQLRRTMMRQRASESPDTKRKIDQEITARVLDSDLFRAAKCVFTYCSTDDEIDTRAVMRAGLEQGKVLCVPRCESARGVMTARRIRSLAELSPGKFDILEPSADTEIVAPQEINLCIVPCLAADPTGFRLGYGGGYYDRFLQQTKGKTAVLCAESRLIVGVPHDAFDIPCDSIYTERRILIREKSET